VTVRSAVVEIDSKLDGGRPKSLAGVREVGIPDVLLPELRERVRRWSERGMHGRVFAPEVGLHFHDLRHTGNPRVERQTAGHLTLRPPHREHCSAQSPMSGRRRMGTQAAAHGRAGEDA
jgi:hypothetical protein